MASILSPSRKREKPGSIRAELSKLRQACEVTVAEIETVQRELNTCEDEKRISGLIARERAASNRLRAIEGDIAAAVERLAVVEAIEREQQLRALRARYGDAVKAFAAKADGVISAIGEVVDALEAIGDAGFAHEFQMMPRPPIIGDGTLAHGVLVRRDIVDAYVENVTAALTPPKRAVAVVPPITPVPAAIDASLPAAQRNLRAGDPSVGKGFWTGNEPQAPAPQRRAPLRETAEPGERLFMLIRGTLELPRKGQLQHGDVVSLRPDEGEPLVMKGAGDWVAADVVASIDASLGEPVSSAEVSQPLGAEPEGAAEPPAAEAELAREQAA